MASFFKRPRRIYFVGDSICGRGFALGTFADQMSVRHALYGFSSPWRMANLVLEENNVDIRCQPYNIGSFTQASLSTDITTLISAQSIQRTDWMVFEDGGDHNSNPPVYQSALEGVLAAALAGTPNVAVMNMFDYSPAPSNDQYDTAFSGTTINQATAAAAASQGALLIDMNATMDAYKTAANAADGVAVMQADGIHPNVWGQMKLAGKILSDLKITPAIKTYASLTAIASANYSALSYGSGTWTQQKAIDYCVAILG